MNAPLISIITATFNRAAFLREAIASVPRDAEHLIIDAASTDGTRELLAEWPHLRVVSEPDEGIYDAWNKGLRLARGEIVGFLNSDDYYLPGAFAAVCEAFSDPEVEVVCGGAEVFRDESGTRTVLRRYTDRDSLALTMLNMTFGVPVINARFFRRSLVDRVGPMNLRYSIAADREFLFRAALANPREVVLDQTLYAYREHAGSLTFRAHVPEAPRYRTEHLEIAEAYLAQPDLSTPDAGLFHRWHRQESAILALTLLLRGEIGPAWQAACRGWRRSPDWPLAVVVCAAEAIGHRLRSRACPGLERR